MSDTIILAIITAVSAILTAWISRSDRHQLHRRAKLEAEVVAANLVKHNAS